MQTIEEVDHYRQIPNSSMIFLALISALDNALYISSLDISKEKLCAPMPSLFLCFSSLRKVIPCVSFSVFYCMSSLIDNLWI